MQSYWCLKRPQGSIIPQLGSLVCIAASGFLITERETIPTLTTSSARVRLRICTLQKSIVAAALPAQNRASHSEFDRYHAAAPRE